MQTLIWGKMYRVSDLELASRHREALVRLQVAAFNKATLDTLVRLVQDPDRRVWNEAIHNALWLRHLSTLLPVESMSAETLSDWAGLSTCPDQVLEYVKQQPDFTYWTMNRRGGLLSPIPSPHGILLEDVDDDFDNLPRDQVHLEDLPKYARSVKHAVDQRYLAVIENEGVWYNLLRNPHLTADTLEILKENDAILGDMPDVFFVDLENDRGVPAVATDLAWLWQTGPDIGMVKRAEHTENLQYKDSL